MLAVGNIRRIYRVFFFFLSLFLSVLKIKRSSWHLQSSKGFMTLKFQVILPEISVKKRFVKLYDNDNPNSFTTLIVRMALRHAVPLLRFYLGFLWWDIKAFWIIFISIFGPLSIVPLFVLCRSFSFYFYQTVYLFLRFLSIYIHYYVSPYQNLFDDFSLSIYIYLSIDTDRQIDRQIAAYQIMYLYNYLSISSSQHPSL